MITYVSIHILACVWCNIYVKRPLFRLVICLLLQSLLIVSLWLFLQESDTEEKSDTSSRESDQIKTLSESLFTLTQEKSKLEGVYLADKKRLLVSFFHSKFYIMEAWWSLFDVSKYFQTIWICLIIVIEIYMYTTGSLLKHWLNHTSSIVFRWQNVLLGVMSLHSHFCSHWDIPQARKWIWF